MDGSDLQLQPLRGRHREGAAVLAAVAKIHRLSWRTSAKLPRAFMQLREEEPPQMPTVPFHIPLECWRRAEEQLEMLRLREELGDYDLDFGDEL